MCQLSQASRVQFQTGYEGEATRGSPGGCGEFPSLIKLFSLSRLDPCIASFFSLCFSQNHSSHRIPLIQFSIYLFVLPLTKNQLFN